MHDQQVAAVHPRLRTRQRVARRQDLAVEDLRSQSPPPVDLVGEYAGVPALQLELAHERVEPGRKQVLVVAAARTFGPDAGEERDIPGRRHRREPGLDLRGRTTRG